MCVKKYICTTLHKNAYTKQNLLKFLEYKVTNYGRFYCNGTEKLLLDETLVIFLETEWVHLLASGTWIEV